MRETKFCNMFYFSGPWCCFASSTCGGSAWFTGSLSVIAGQTFHQAGQVRSHQDGQFTYLVTKKSYLFPNIKERVEY